MDRVSYAAAFPGKAKDETIGYALQDMAEVLALSRPQHCIIWEAAKRLIGGRDIAFELNSAVDDGVTDLEVLRSLMKEAAYKFQVAA